MVERITMLSGPPVLRRRYLVPTVTYFWLSGADQVYPVFLPKHEDAEHLNFASLHYHVDPRFLSAAAWNKAKRRVRLSEYDRDDYAAFRSCQGYPLARRSFDADGQAPHPPIVWRSLVCKRSDITWAAPEISEKLSPHFTGRQCKRARGGWVCPHKRFPLGSIAPVGGVITCPLHGLRIDAETGKVL